MPDVIPPPWRGESHRTPGRSEADALATFIDASPTPYHAAAEVAARLSEAGFTEVAETDRWPTRGGRYFVRRDGSLVAWSTEAARERGAPYRIVGAHTDSPTLRIKPRPDGSRGGWQMLGVEPYGGGLFHTWLDRDLGLAGRVSVREEGRAQTRLLSINRPILQIPSLAIHLDREVRERGVQLNPQTHLEAVWGIGTGPGEFRAFLAQQLGVESGDVLGWEMLAHDVTPSARMGVDGDLLSAPRLDNLASCHAGASGLIEAAGQTSRFVPMLAVFDHEEVGSVSGSGAGSTLLRSVLERVTVTAGGEREDLYRALAGTIVASADMAHATHPNYVDKHEPAHHIAVNGGPVLKTNANLRYATDATGTAEFRLACDRAGVPLQHYVHRSDLPCGSTIGPMTAAGIGVTTVDVGAPQLAMHAIRELCGAADPAMYAAALGAFLTPRD